MFDNIDRTQNETYGRTTFEMCLKGSGNKRKTSLM